MSNTDNQSFIDCFRNAAPYIHAHHGKTFVLQIGGDVVASDAFTHLIHDLALLNSLSIKLVIVFGARPQIDALLKERNITPLYNGALRVTDEASMSSVKQAVGDVKFQIEALLSMGLPNSPMEESAIKVASGNYVTGRPYGVVNGIDLELTGKVRSVEKETINARLGAGEIVLVPPMGYSVTGEIFNLSSIEVAAQVAIDLSADKLIMINHDSLLKNENGETIRQLTCEQAKTKLDPVNKNHIDETPSTALALGIKACKAGVNRIHYIDQNIDGGVLQELFTRDGVGTLLSGTPFDTIHQATVNDIGGILELIEPLEEQGVLVKRSREKIEIDIDDYIVLVRDGSVIACAALHQYPEEKVAEIACMVVHPDYQKQEKGELLYELMETLAIKGEIKTLFLLTTQTVHWFIEKGFVEAQLEDLPVKKQTLYNYQRNSKILIKSLD
ncbi:MAG: amino-acid N-acetyltransferase [Proteobacteria bacterium]|nr:amino-acid N-acetyltransferase [Pseudomonadota bacterium]NOG59638.1 amino-acid N-acetyltransferase [Pseudomonadota bacterium]